MPFRGSLTALVGEDSNKSHHPQAQQHHTTYSNKSILQHDSMTPEKDFMTLIKGGSQKRCLYDTFGVMCGWECGSNQTQYFAK